MKKTLLLLIFGLFLVIAGMAQTRPYTIAVDSIELTSHNTGNNTQLRIKNSTRSRTGAFLQNFNDGRTRFAWAIDSAWVSSGYLKLSRATHDTLSVAVDARPYKVYTALLTQTGTSEPTAVVLENTFPGGMVWSRISAGVYRVAQLGAFTDGKTVSLQDQTRYKNIGGDQFYSIYLYRISSSYMEMIILDDSNNPIEEVLDNKLLELRVYN